MQRLRLGITCLGLRLPLGQEYANNILLVQTTCPQRTSNERTTNNEQRTGVFSMPAPTALLRSRNSDADEEQFDYNKTQGGPSLILSICQTKN